ncbi:MAG: hypothetical protein NTZ83_02340, partial [Candidatus Pacearchaeota archaeon]|nr:hypothetical protein [Candidatus Pacearchaeota archaeon]
TSLIPLFQQGNDVRETYKLPQGYLNDNLKEQSPIFEKVNKIALNYLNLRFSGWQEVGRLEKWEDAVEIYPLLEGKHFIKGEGIERLLPKINEEVKAYICCDGRNDMSLVDSIVEKFPNYHVVCPSNVSIELKKMLGDKNYNYTILQEDCTKFGEGLEKI